MQRIPPLGALLATGVLLTVAAAAPAAAHAAAPAPSLPHVTISPLAGTPDASPTTQISFLGVPAADISQVVARGSRSGSHRGTLEAYSTGTGASLVPLRGFTAGETVTVHAIETVSGRHQTIGTTFTVGSFWTIPPPTPPSGSTGSTGSTGTTGAKGTVKPKLPVPTGPPPVLSFLTAPSLHPSLVTVTQPAADPALGDIFLTPVDGAVQAGAMIINPAGQLVWFSAAPVGSQAADLRVQEYQDKPVLTWWQGRIAYGHGLGVGMIDNTSYQQIAAVKAGNGLNMDLHDFQLEPNGTALITVYQPVHWNLSAVHGAANGIIEDCIVQQIDVRTGLVMFEWHALGHVPLTASYSKAQPYPSAVWDWFHINSIDVQPSQNILISSRNTWAVYQIGHSLGEVLWRLGGKYSSFALGPGVRFAWQHDATLLHDGSIEIFDNEDTPKIAGQSRAIDVGLSYTKHTATLLHQYVNPKQAVLSASQGDVQQLDNTDNLVGWGQVGLVSEFSSSGALTFQLALPPLVESYRAFRFPWAAAPAVPPVVYAQRAAGAATTTVAASWERRHRRGLVAGARRGVPDIAERRGRPGAVGRLRDPPRRGDGRSVRERRGPLLERSGPRAGDAGGRGRRLARGGGLHARARLVIRNCDACAEPMTPTELDALSAFVVAAAVAAVLTPMTMRLARRVGAIDQPRARGLSDRDTPRLGGIAIFAATAVAGVIWLPHVKPWTGILAAGALITLVGALDDCFDFPAGLKLIGQIAAAVIAVVFGGVDVTFVTLPLLGHLTLGSAAQTLTVIGLVGMMNVVNFSDGVDGLAAGLCAIIVDRLLR